MTGEGEILHRKFMPTGKWSKYKKGAVGVVALIVAMVAVGCTATGGKGGAAHGTSAAVVTSSAGRPGSQTGKAKGVPGPAQKLAALDGSGRPAEQYQQVLDALAPRCKEDRSGLADVVNGALRNLRRHGVDDADAFGVLQQLERSVPAGNPRVTCASVASAYVKTREEG